MRYGLKLLAIAAIAAIVPATTAVAEPWDDRKFDLVAGESATWHGDDAAGANVNYHGLLNVMPATLPVPRNLPDQLPDEVEGPAEAALAGVPNANPAYGPYTEQMPAGVCSDNPRTYCDYTLVSVTNPVPETDPDGKLTRSATVTLTGARGDLDFFVYASDAEGTEGAQVANAGCPCSDPTLDERATVSVVTTRPHPSKPGQGLVSTQYYLIKVIYFATAPAGYDMTFAF